PLPRPPPPPPPILSFLASPLVLLAPFHLNYAPSLIIPSFVLFFLSFIDSSSIHPSVGLFPFVGCACKLQRPLRCLSFNNPSKFNYTSTNGTSSLQLRILIHDIHVRSEKKKRL
ncbi:hypothetical protein BC829DRAFT_383186, partial [Chytridium lagenaria]